MLAKSLTYRCFTHIYLPWTSQVVRFKAEHTFSSCLRIYVLMQSTEALAPLRAGLF
jgi:hypothetical protein